MWEMHKDAARRQKYEIEFCFFFCTTYTRECQNYLCNINWNLCKKCEREEEIQKQIFNKIHLEFLRQIIDMWNMRYILLCPSGFSRHDKHVTQFCASSAAGTVKAHQNCATRRRKSITQLYKHDKRWISKKISTNQ